MALDVPHVLVERDLGGHQRAGNHVSLRRQLGDGMLFEFVAQDVSGVVVLYDACQLHQDGGTDDDT